MRFFKKLYKSRSSIIVSCIFSLIFIIGLNTVFGQTYQDKPELSFQRIQQQLLSNTVSDIYQDQWGFIWIGTYSGLHRYDGIDFHGYTSSNEDSSSLDNNFIQDIYEDQEDTLWIRTRLGINKYNRATDNFTTYDIPTNHNVFVNNKSIDEDDDGRLWIAGNEGIYYYDREQQTFVLSKNLSESISSIRAGQGTILWIATLDNGLIKFNTESAVVEEIFTHKPEDSATIGSDDINVLELDPEGNLWIGTDNAGLDRMVVEDGKIYFVHYRHDPKDPSSLGNDDISSLEIDNEGRLWVGNENAGLHLYNEENNNFYHYKHDPKDPKSLSSNSIYCLFQDQAGRYWVGSGLNGLNIADPYTSKFTHYNTSASKESWLTNGIIRDFYEAENGDIWIATDGGGLNYFDRSSGTFEAYRHNPDDSNSLQSDAVLEIDRDKSGRLWVGTWGGGLNILTDEEEGTFISFQKMIANHKYPINNVFDVHFDSQHNYIWIAALDEALYRYNNSTGKLLRFVPDSLDTQSISSNVIQNIFEDSDGNLWISTELGLNLIKAEDKEEVVFEKYRHDEDDSTSISSDIIWQVYEDSRNNIWAVTKGGLSKYIEEKDHFINYDKNDGLPSHEIRSLAESDDQNLWIGTIKGLSEFDPEKETFKNYDSNDGLQSNEFARHSSHRLRSGELLFGGINGFNLFHPDDISINPHAPPVYLSDFKLNNVSVKINDDLSLLERHISMTDTLVLSYEHNVFSFDFVALNYTNPDQNEYAYLLEGFEEKWNYVGNKRTATYTNLDPGEYTFRVKASNNDGVWNEEGADLALIITPPFWQTSWFYILSTVFVIGVLLGGYRFRVRRIQEHNRQLEQEVANRTADLENTLEELKSTRNELVKKAHKAGMADIASGVLHNVGNILNSVNTSATIIENTVKESKLEGLRKANSILKEHIGHIDEFITEDPKGKKLLEYYMKLEKPFSKEQDKVIEQAKRLNNKIKLINEVIAAQQSYAGAQMDSDQISLEEMIEEALALQSGSIDRHGLTINKELETVDPIVSQHSKLVHILVNLIKNAKEAMADNAPAEKVVVIKTWQDVDNVYLSISDNGEGIKEENLSKVFTQGFTTKDSGHGFGLHSSANYMSEMEGSIDVESEGENQGATFTLTFSKVGKHSQTSKQNSS